MGEALPSEVIKSLARHIPMARRIASLISRYQRRFQEEVKAWDQEATEDYRAAREFDEKLAKYLGEKNRLLALRKRELLRKIAKKESQRRSAPCTDPPLKEVRMKSVLLKTQLLSERYFIETQGPLTLGGCGVAADTCGMRISSTVSGTAGSIESPQVAKYMSMPGCRRPWPSDQTSRYRYQGSIDN